MFTRKHFPGLIGIISLSGMFLMAPMCLPLQECVDNDWDGYGSPTTTDCVYAQLDCDDTNPAVNPGALEGPFDHLSCSDGLDNDCNGSTDVQDSSCWEGSNDANCDDGNRVFPDHNPWNTDVSSYPLHPDSETFIESIGRANHLHPDFGTFWNGVPNGIPYMHVRDDQEKVPVTFYYEDESDPGPYPIPTDVPIEGGPASTGDRHVLVLDIDNCMLYELFDAWPVDGGRSWEAGSGAIFELTSNLLRPDGWTSADAAGLPIYPGLVRYEEVVERGEINHALRFTVSPTQRGYIHPATHYASSRTDPALPPMGLRVRMKASYDCSGFSLEVQVICTALKKYGMFVADNGSNWFISGAPDSRWSDENLADLKHIYGNAFEVVFTGEIHTD